MQPSLFSLKVRSVDPLAIVEIADANYRLVAQRGGSVSARVVPGLYVVRAKYASRVEKRIVRVGASDVVVEFDRPASTADEFAAAEMETRISSSVHKSRASAGLRSWITIVVAGVNVGPEPAQPPAHSVSDFGICIKDGKPLKKFDSASIVQAATESDKGLPGIIASLDLPVGWYSLSMPSVEGPSVLLPLYVSPRYSPTVFIESRMRDSRPWIDFDRLLVSYDGREYDSYTDPMRLEAIQLARRSLELGRNLLTSSFMGILLQQKFMDPTLGLLALQLLLLPVNKLEEKSRKKRNRASPNREDIPPEAVPASERFVDVLMNMASALGEDHPDLVIARAQARKLGWNVPVMRGDGLELVAPPLLRASWNQMVAMPDRRREITSRGNLLYSVGQSLLCAGIWLLWKPPAELTSSSKRTSISKRLTPTKRVFANSSKNGSAAPAMEKLPSVRAPRTADGILEDIVEMVRGGKLADQVQQSWLDNYSTGTVLDRTIAQAVLQLVNTETPREQAVPRGYASRMAKSLTLPLPLVADAASGMRSSLLQQDPHLQRFSSVFQKPYSKD